MVSGDRLEVAGIVLCVLGAVSLVLAASVWGPHVAAAVAGVLVLTAGVLIIKAAAAKGGES